MPRDPPSSLDDSIDQNPPPPVPLPSSEAEAPPPTDPDSVIASGTGPSAHSPPQPAHPPATVVDSLSLESLSIADNASTTTISPSVHSTLPHTSDHKTTNSIDYSAAASFVPLDEYYGGIPASSYPVQQLPPQDAYHLGTAWGDPSMNQEGLLDPASPWDGPCERRKTLRQDKVL
ncbi:hypothetical protein T439DRAFT_137072 [Meredithblackwellia eburnea MCA 4105]